MYGGGPPRQDSGWGARSQGSGGFPPQQQQQQGYHQPPPHMQGGGPRHAGLGASGAAPNLPPPPQLPRAPNFSPAGGFPGGSPTPAWTGEKFSLFVGSIADGVSDGWLERILGTVGTVLSMRRPSPPFAFVEYGDAEAVLRCLEVVNGATLTGKSGQEKALLVKADEKTTARLDEYKTSRVKSESQDEYLLQAKDDLAAIIVRMNAGDLPSTSTLSNDQSSANPTSGGRSLAHLQDLDAQDLPEQHREIVTSEIALFRERAAKRAAEKAQMEAQMEARRNSGPAAQQNRGWGPRGGASPSVDPQSYNKPIGFVGQGQGAEVKQEAAAEPVIDDAQRERERAEREHRQAQVMFEDRQRRFEARERARIAGYERERNRERVVMETEDRERVMMRERLATWDDDVEADKGREAFYADRLRWRAQRKPFRAREQEADARDHQAEATQLEAINKASEAFLDQQADLFAEMSKGELKTSNGANPDEPAVKLSFGATTKPVVKAPPPTRATAFGSAEDEDEGKKKRELIPLNYSDDEDEKPKVKGKLSAVEREKKVREIGEKVPTTKEGLWSYSIKWSALTEDMINTKLAPFATKTIVEYLGSEEEELLSAVTSHLRAHKDAAALVDELEPVLDEEATEFVVKVWKILIYELELAQAGISQ